MGTSDAEIPDIYHIHEHLLLAWKFWTAGEYMAGSCQWVTKKYASQLDERWYIAFLKNLK